MENKKSDLIIKQLRENDTIPFDLLLLADETREAIEKYIYQVDIYIAETKEGTQPIAAFVLYRVNDTDIEIKNIAVTESLQGNGFGSLLLSEIKKIAIATNVKSIIVGTPDTATKEIRFYEKNGFIKFGLKKNFFIENYPYPIIENGQMLQDMVMLKMRL